MKRLLLACLILCLLAPLAHAQMFQLEDSATPGAGTILGVATRSATASSGPVASGGRQNALLRFRVSTCAGSCIWANYTLEAYDAAGTIWVPYCISAGPINAVGTYFMLVSGTQSDAAVATDANLQSICKKPLPPQFRLTITWTSGTSSSTVLTGYSW